MARTQLRTEEMQSFLVAREEKQLGSRHLLLHGTLLAHGRDRKRVGLMDTLFPGCLLPLIHLELEAPEGKHIPHSLYWRNWGPRREQGPKFQSG